MSAKRGNYSCRDLHVRKLHVKMVEKFFRFFNFNNVMYSVESALLLTHILYMYVIIYSLFVEDGESELSMHFAKVDCYLCYKENSVYW